MFPKNLQLMQHLLF